MGSHKLYVLTHLKCYKFKYDDDDDGDNHHYHHIIIVFIILSGCLKQLITIKIRVAFVQENSLSTCLLRMRATA